MRNLDKITAPLLLQSILAPLSEWEIYSGLRWFQKPTELLNFYPEGIYTLVKPGQRMTSQQTTVDLFCFWKKIQIQPRPSSTPAGANCDGKIQKACQLEWIWTFQRIGHNALTPKTRGVE
jgi:hypothetical protein